MGPTSSKESRAAFTDGNRLETVLPDSGKRVWFRLLTGTDERRLPQPRRAAGGKLLSAMLAFRVSEEAIEKAVKAYEARTIRARSYPRIAVQHLHFSWTPPARPYTLDLGIRFFSYHGMRCTTSGETEWDYMRG